MLSLCKVYFVISTRFQHNSYFTRTMQMLRLSVLGMIAAAALLLMKPVNQPSVSCIDWKSWVIFGVVCLFTILPMFLKNTAGVSKKSAEVFKKFINLLSHPILLIVLAGVVGYVIYGWWIAFTAFYLDFLQVLFGLRDHFATTVAYLCPICVIAVAFQFLPFRFLFPLLKERLNTSI